MIEKILEKFVQRNYISKLQKLETEIGCKIIFRHIPERFINGWVNCDMTKTWKNFGLNIDKGANYFTIGHIVDGYSSRFDQESPEYQSWLGWYTLKLAPEENWTTEDHCKLAIADQNSWLRRYGDLHPMTSIEGWKFTPMDQIQVGTYSGQLYEGGCTTHSDVGKGFNSLGVYAASFFMAALFNFSNPALNLKAKALRPISSNENYKILKLKGYIAIFDIKENVKAVFYGNGAIVHNEDGTKDTFEILKNDLLNALKSCDIVTT